MAATWPNSETLSLFSLSLPWFALPAPNRCNSRPSFGRALATTPPPPSAYLSFSLPLKHSLSLSRSAFLSKSLSLSLTTHHDRSWSPFFGKPTAICAFPLDSDGTDHHGRSLAAFHLPWQWCIQHVWEGRDSPMSSAILQPVSTTARGANKFLLMSSSQ